MYGIRGNNVNRMRKQRKHCQQVMRVHPMMPQQKQMMQLLQIRQMTAQRQLEQRAPQQAVIRLQLVLHRLDTNLTGVPLPQIPV